MKKLKKRLLLSSLVCLMLVFFFSSTAQAADVEEKIIDVSGSLTHWYFKDLHPSETLGSSIFMAWNCNVTGAGYSLTKIEFFGRSFLMSSSDYIAVRIYDVTGTVGIDAIPTGSPLQSWYFSVTDVFNPSFYRWRNITLPSSFPLTAGVDYAIAFEAYNGTFDATHYVDVGYTGSMSAENLNGIYYYAGSYYNATLLPLWKVYVVDPPVPTPTPSVSRYVLPYAFTAVALSSLTIVVGIAAALIVIVISKGKDAQGSELAAAVVVGIAVSIILFVLLVILNAFQGV